MLRSAILPPSFRMLSDLSMAWRSRSPSRAGLPAALIRWACFALFAILLSSEIPAPSQDTGDVPLLREELRRLRAEFPSAAPGRREELRLRIEELKVRLSALEAPPPSSAPAPGPAGPYETGVREWTFGERHGESDPVRMAARLSMSVPEMRRHDPGLACEIAKEKFAGYVPAIEGKEPVWGLLVWIGPGDAAWIDPAWVPVLDEFKLIFAGPLNAGNERFVWHRAGLALDTAANIARRYPVDPERVYIGGFSGGGRVASTLGLHYPDVFRGGYYQGGCNYFQDIPSGEAGDRRVWPARIARPAGDRLSLARSRSRHVLMAGESCFNYEHARRVADRMGGADGFASVLFQGVSGLGHAPAPAAELRKGLEFLDRIPAGGRR